jgi:hypothetical protein
MPLIFAFALLAEAIAEPPRICRDRRAMAKMRGKDN